MVSSFAFRGQCALLLLTLLLFVVADAKKELPLGTPFPERVLNAIGCDVCAYTVGNALEQVQTQRDTLLKHGVTLREEEILTILEELCNPFKEGGEWIRRVTVTTGVNSRTNRLGISTDVLDYYAACKRSCSSVRDLCERVISDDHADGLSAILLRIARSTTETITTRENLREVTREVCDPMSFCVGFTSFQQVVGDEMSAVADGSGPLQRIIADDAPKKVDEEEMEVERLMHKMQTVERKKTDVFSREEIREMQDAIIRGDREAVAKLDPAIMDLTEEEFQSIRQMLMTGDGDRVPEIPEPEADWQAFDDDDL